MITLSPRERRDLPKASVSQGSKVPSKYQIPPPQCLESSPSDSWSSAPKSHPEVYLCFSSAESYKIPLFFYSNHSYLPSSILQKILGRRDFPGGSAVKNPPAMQETQVMQFWSLGGEDPLEEEMATYSSILAWRIPCTEEPGGLQSIGFQKVGH